MAGKLKKLLPKVGAAGGTAGVYYGLEQAGIRPPPEVDYALLGAAITPKKARQDAAKALNDKVFKKIAKKIGKVGGSAALRRAAIGPANLIPAAGLGLAAYDIGSTAVELNNVANDLVEETKNTNEPLTKTGAVTLILKSIPPGVRNAVKGHLYGKKIEEGGKTKKVKGVIAKAREHDKKRQDYEKKRWADALKKHKRPIKSKKGGQIKKTKRKARGKPRGVGKALRGYGAVSR